MPPKKKKVVIVKATKTVVEETPIIPVPSPAVETKPERIWEQIDPNLLAGKAMLFIDAIEKEIAQGHLQEWTAVVERFSALVQSHSANKKEN